jgi:hypothetical protein
MSDLPPLPEDWREQQDEIVKFNDFAARKLIREILAEESPTSFHFTLGRIMERLREENGVLVRYEKSSIPQVAWATRNIMELRIWTRFVCQSQGNLDRFVNDLATVGASTMRAQLRLVNDLADKVPNPIRPVASQYKQVASMQDSRSELGLEYEGPLMARTYAKSTGLEKEYLAISSVTSPLVHPSAISVLRTFNIECYRDSLTGHGIMNSGELIIDARQHIEANGFKPAK